MTSANKYVAPMNKYMARLNRGSNFLFLSKNKEGKEYLSPFPHVCCDFSENEIALLLKKYKNMEVKKVFCKEATQQEA